MENGIKTTDSALPEFGLNFATVASANLASIGLVAGDITTLNTLRTPFMNGLDTVEAAKQSVKGAVTAKETAKAAYVSKLRELANKVLGTPNAPANVINQLGLNPPHSKPTKKSPTVPSNVSAVAFAIGVNEIKWKPNGNIAGTQYVVEYTFDTSEWIIAGTTTATKFSHTGQTPGTALWYRVTAQRRNIQSEPSQSVGVYIPTPSLFMQENQAA